MTVILQTSYAELQNTCSKRDFRLDENSPIYQCNPEANICRPTYDPRTNEYLGCNWFDGFTLQRCQCPQQSPIDDVDVDVDDDVDADVFAAAVVIGSVLTVVVIGAAIFKGSFGKTSSKGTQKDAFTKSALQSYKSDFTKKYSGRPPWMHPETNTYGYEAAKSTETSPSHVMRPEDFDLRRIEGVGITNPPSSNPPPRNVIYKRTANSVNLRWDPPTTHDTSSGNVFQGYDVYYQERIPTSTDWVTRHIAVPTQNEITIQNPPLQSQNFGVRVVYKTPDGSIFYSDGILGTINGG